MANDQDCNFDRDCAFAFQIVTIMSMFHWILSSEILHFIFRQTAASSTAHYAPHTGMIIIMVNVFLVLHQFSNFDSLSC